MNLKKEQKVKISESAIELQELQDIASITERNNKLIIDFIIAHAPFPEDEDLTILVPMLLSVNSHNDKHISKENDQEVDYLSSLASQFVSALVSNDEEHFLGSLDVYSYLDYINKFESPTDKENAIKEAMDIINRGGLLVSGGILSSDKGQAVEIVLQYSDGKEVSLDLHYKKYEDNHYTDKEENYVFTTPLQQIVDVF